MKVPKTHEEIAKMLRDAELSRPAAESVQTPGGRIRHLRIRAGKTLRATALELGVTHVQLGEIERGRVAVPAWLRTRLAAVLPGFADVLNEAPQASTGGGRATCV